MTYSRLIATGSCLPEKILTNRDLEAMVDTSDAWIRERTGIVQRHIASDHESSASMGTLAAQKAMEYADFDPNLIDLIIVATSTSDRLFPSTACLIQEKLHLHGFPAFDVTAACSGFSYALATADNFIRAGQAKHALVIGSEVMSRVIDWTDRSTCILFADGAGAVLLSAADEPGIHSTHLHADGRYQDLLYVPSPLPRYQERPLPYMKMEGSEVFKVAVNELGKLVHETMLANGLSESELDWLVPHQANLRIITAVAKKLSLPMSQVVITLDRHGNTSAASIPIALDCAIRDGRIQRGQKLLLESFGGGFTWGSALITY